MSGDNMTRLVPNPAIPMEHLIESDGTTVWVHNPQGDMIGRFGRMGIDIHSDFETMTGGGGECLMCTHRPTTSLDWEAFKQGMLRHYDVVVTDDYRPDRFA